MAAMIARALNMGISNDITATGFADEKDIPSWAKSAVKTVKDMGIVEGRGGNRFAPDATATRAEAVTIILNLLDSK